jgi:hypothetical protein
MKSRALAILFLVLIVASPAVAQTATDELEAARTQIQADRKAIVSRLMGMSETESNAFWPVYNTYREDIRKIDDKLVAVAESYFSSPDSLSDKDAQSLLSDWMKLRADKLNLRKSYVKKFSKAIPTTKLVRFYQIENKMDAVIEYEMAASIPLVQ